MATRGVSVGARRSTARKATRTKARTQALHAGHPAVLLGMVTAILVTVGLVMILSSSSVASFASSGSSFVYFQRQALWVLIGFVGYVAAVRTDYRKLRKLGYPAMALACVLLVLVMVPGVGVNISGSSRWINLGPISFQPSEFAKLALTLFLAEAYVRKKEDLFSDFAHTAMPFLPGLGILVILVMAQPDLGTTMVLSFIGIGMLFIAGAPLRYVLPMGAGGTVLAIGAALSADYRRARVLAFLDPWADPLNTGYHTIQSLIAVGSGGWFGLGLGASRQKWMYVPNAHTDFIFAILAEEMGLVGSLTVIGLFSFLAYLGIKTAQRAPDRFGMLVASGITIWVSMQAFVNMGAVTGSLPITGVPLPLVSFGGTSLLFTLIGMGILTNIAAQGRFGTRSASKDTDGEGREQSRRG